MFKNRALQVKMVKNDTDDIPTVDQAELFYKNANLIGCHIRNSIAMIGKVVITYVAVDTVRQVIINKTK